MELRVLAIFQISNHKSTNILSYFTLPIKDKIYILKENIESSDYILAYFIRRVLEFISITLHLFRYALVSNRLEIRLKIGSFFSFCHLSVVENREIVIST